MANILLRQLIHEEVKQTVIEKIGNAVYVGLTTDIHRFELEFIAEPDSSLADTRI